MNREELKRVGPQLSASKSGDGTITKTIYQVSFGGDVVGVGMFESDRDDCKLAFVKAAASQRSLLCELTDEFPIESNDIYHLKRLYTELFPAS